MKKESITNINEFGFIFKHYSETSINEIISDLKEVKHKNQKFIYAVDIYDIVENYLPYTKNNSFSNINLQSKVQKYFCYDYFFNNSLNAPIVVLNEYKMELLAAKNKLLHDLKKTNAVLQNIEDLKKNTQNFTIHNEIAHEYFREHLEIILLLTIIDSKKTNVVNEFLRLLKDKLSVTEVVLNTDNNSDIVTNAFEEITYSNNVVNVFEKFIELNKFKLLSTPKEKFQERHIYLENTFRDIQAIDRVRMINKNLEIKNSGYTIIYLSSAFKTTKIIEAFDKYYGDNFLNYREIFQVFLFDRICKEFGNNLDAGIDILEKINRLRNKFTNQKIFESNKDFDEETNNSLTIIKKIFSYESNEIENHFLLGAYYENYGNLNEKNTQSNSVIGDYSDKILTILKEVSKSSERHRNNVFDLNFSLSQMYQTAGVALGLNNITHYNPSYISGLDIIKNCHQHLPNLIFWHIEINERLKEKLYRFINENIEIPSDDNKKSIDSFNELISLLVSNNLINKQKVEKTVLFSFLNLITQMRKENNEANNFNSLEKHLITDLEQCRLTINLDSEELIFQNGKNISAKQNDLNPLEIEIVYLLIWLYRRNNLADKALELGEEVLKRQKNSSDFRIYQGMALANIDKFYKRNSNGEYLNFNKDFLEISISSIEKTVNAFPHIGSLELNNSLHLIILKNYCAVLNSLTDLNIRNFKNFAKKDYEIIGKCKMYIKEIKDLFSQINLNFDNHLTYSVTELELHYLEVKSLLEQNKKQEALQKHLIMLRRNDTLRKINKLNDYVDNYFTEIFDEIDSLTLEFKLNKIN